MPRRGPASPARAAIGGHCPAAAVPKPRLAKAAIISELPAPARLLAASPVSAPPTLLASPRFSRPHPAGPERAAGTMFRRKLTALDYHNPAGFNCKGEEAAPGPQRVRDRPAAAFSAPASGLSTWTVRGLVSPAPLSSRPRIPMLSPILPYPLPTLASASPLSALAELQTPPPQSSSAPSAL